MFHKKREGSPKELTAFPAYGKIPLLPFGAAKRQKCAVDIKGGWLLPNEGRDAYGMLEKAAEAFDGSGMLRRYGLHTDHKSLLTARMGPDGQ
ncbi:MAG: hypothetical protein IKI17_02260 [Oscillospiraceae bacterium]|nr:hypothetical protein [Oscillospiraceae bacterium]